MRNSNYHKVSEETVYLKLTREDLTIALYGAAKCREMLSDGKHPIYTEALKEALKEACKTLDAILVKHNDVPAGKLISFKLKRGMLCDITRALLGYADAMWKAGKDLKMLYDLRAVWKKLHEQRELHEVKAIQKGWR